MGGRRPSWIGDWSDFRRRRDVNVVPSKWDVAVEEIIRVLIIFFSGFILYMACWGLP